MNFSLAAARAGFSAGFMGGRDVAASGSADCGIGVPSVTVTSLAWLVLSAGAGLTTGGITEEDIDRIADRVIQRLSAQVIESIAWDIVPDITEKIVREELKRIDES